LVLEAAVLEQRRGSAENEESEATLPREKEERRASNEEKDLVVVELEAGTDALAQPSSGASPREK
jgi:hypothetical protein